MRILEYGKRENPTIMLIHGFESPYQIWDSYIEHYKERFHILVPILPGHDTEEKTEFTSFAKVAGEIEDYCLSLSLDHLYLVYGMSMGGVVTSHLWMNKRITFDKIVMESSPLLGFAPWMTKIMTKQYLTITQKARERDKATVRNAVNSMVTEDMLDVFLELLDNISDKTIQAYVKEIGGFKLPKNIDTPNTKVFYFYGGKINEVLFRSVAKHIERNYSNATSICLDGKGHCEDALLNPSRWMEQLDRIVIRN